MWPAGRATLAFLALSLLFLILNRGAYQSYFSDDEIDNLSWAPFVPAHVWLSALLTPRVIPDNFRPAGHFFFLAANKLFGLGFPKYVLALQALHLFNAWLIWRLARKLDIADWPALAGSAFFLLGMAAFDAFWKPMYIFDVLCTTFVLSSMLLYAHGRWILSFLAFWLAYKSKELAVMLPLALACYEFWFGRRRWLPLTPFFAAALSFGLQGLLTNGARPDVYTFHFTPAALAQTLPFYSSRVLLVPYAGLALLALPFLARDRRVWFGIAAMCLFFAPLLFLSGRIYGAYCYLPLTGLAIALAAVASLVPPLYIAIFFAFWLPWNIRELRISRKAALAVAEETKPFIRDILVFARTHNPPPAAILYDGAPVTWGPWGVSGTFKYAYGMPKLEPVHISDPRAKSLAHADTVALLIWNRPHRTTRFLEHRSTDRDATFITMNTEAPLWQLDDGWGERGRDFRWCGPHATAHLWRPAGATRFELHLDEQNGVKPGIRLSIDGRDAGTGRSDAHAIEWILEPAPEGVSHVSLDMTGPAAVSSFGFSARP